jgi:membrane protein implicated in regulation of membrane protease activity
VARTDLSRSRDLNWVNLLTVVSVLILIGTEVFGVALAAGWALAGLFELGDAIGHVLMGLFSLLALYVVYLLWRRASHIEPIRGGDASPFSGRK